MGAEKLPQGAFIACSNHSSHMDSAIIAMALGRPFSDYGFLAAYDYWYAKNRRFHMHSVFHLIPIDRRPEGERELSLEETNRRCQNFVNTGKILVVYPEGTRSRDGQLLAFKKGAARLAIDLNIPIVPIYIKGSFESWPKGRKIMRPRKIEVTIGDAINSKNQETQGLTSILESAIRNLMVLTCFCFILLASTSWAQTTNGVIKEFYPSGKIKSEITYKNDHKNGPVNTYYETGGLRTTCLLKDDFSVGFFYMYFSNGQLKYEDFFKAGKRFNLSKEYDVEGQLLMQCHYDDDKLNGLFKSYDATGVPVAIGSYTNNKREGLWKFYEKGQLLYKDQYKRGLRVERTAYSKKGKVLWHRTY
ncbi:MAG: hypothetical protein EXS67_01610 [Candidatus Margulisbacteria bacterium]|nr:hypothetical protein [Candidatus Margulisiibacteriota bacterium]